MRRFRGRACAPSTPRPGKNRRANAGGSALPAHFPGNGLDALVNRRGKMLRTGRLAGQATDAVGSFFLRIEGAERGLIVKHGGTIVGLENFRDFLRLILAVGCTNPLQQIVWWDRQQFEDFIRGPEEAAYAASPEVAAVLRAIGEHLDLTPMEDPFGYVKGLQTDFPYERIPFSNEYYDTLGLERPDGTEPEENGFAFEAAAFTFPSEP